MNTIYGTGTYEDVEYCFTVRQLGKHVLYVPTAWGYHFVGGSIRQGAGPRGFNLSMNRMMFRGRWAGMLSWDEWQRW
jgi:GT2 family glycosyltransferase